MCLEGLVGSQMEFDEVLRQHVGQFGFYQKILFFILASELIFNQFQTLNIVFLGLTPPFTCLLPPVPDNNCSYDQLKDFFIPSHLENGQIIYDHCHIYIRNATIDDLNEMCLSGNSINKTGFIKTKCQGYHYEKSHYTSTLVTKWNLVCDRASYVATISAVLMGGRLLGSLIFGSITDKYGRKPILLIMTVIHIITSILLALMPSPMWFLVVRFIQGMAMTSRSVAAFVIAIETIGPKWRVIAGNILMMVWGVSYATFAGIGYLFHDWQHLQLTLSIPELILLILFIMIVPESPRWLLVKGKKEKALNILRNIACKNGKHIPDDIDVIVKVDKVSATILDLLRRPKIRWTSINFFFNWFTLGGVYYALILNTSNFAGDPFLNCFISGALEVVGYLSCIYVMTHYGRVKSLGGYILLGSIALLATIPIPLSLSNLQVSLTMISKFFIASAHSMDWIFTPEVYPTSVRSVTISYCGVCTRVSSVISSYIFLLSSYNRAYPLLILGGSSLVAGILVYFLPETKGQALPQTMEECEKLISERSINICRSRKPTAIKHNIEME